MQLAHRHYNESYNSLYAFEMRVYYVDIHINIQKYYQYFCLCDEIKAADSLVVLELCLPIKVFILETNILVDQIESTSGKIGF